MFRALCIDDQNANQQGNKTPEGETESPGTVPPSPGRRRVTFSNQVKACPPPDDSKYPEPELAPLKADVLVEGRVKRIRRSKEAKRCLSDEQKCEIREIARATIQALQTPTMIACVDGSSETEACQMHTAKRRLEILSENFKFSVQYTNFPKVCRTIAWWRYLLD
ncbi:unnamed protein product [Cylicostephanus goldi]|uniref:Uncharacterized protein n=1 Tax=Cylicostephanus goldi TaxID=71465 RepID=A0A3P7NET1_CYLGO|nr:unnamed protein product [Cylicostephanus goldi]